jgi:hypothetical protein
MTGVGAIAAGIVVGAVVVAQNTRSGSSSDVAAKASGPVSAELIQAGDLGDLADAQALRDRLQPGLHLSSRESAASPSSPMAPPGAASGATDAAGGAPAPAAAAAGPTASSANTAPRATVPEERLAGRPSAPCEGAARALQQGDQVLVYVASARWQGTPAEVLGFSPPGAQVTSSGRPAPTRVYVLARSGCRLLVFQSYAP